MKMVRKLKTTFFQTTLLLKFRMLLCLVHQIYLHEIRKQKIFFSTAMLSEVPVLGYQHPGYPETGGTGDFCYLGVYYSEHIVVSEPTAVSVSSWLCRIPCSNGFLTMAAS